MGFITAVSARACERWAEGVAWLLFRSEQEHRFEFSSEFSGAQPRLCIHGGHPCALPWPLGHHRLLARVKDPAGVDGIPMGTAVASGGSGPVPALLSHPPLSQPGPGTGRAPDTAEPVSGLPPAPRAASGRASCPGAEKTALSCL